MSTSKLIEVTVQRKKYIDQRPMYAARLESEDSLFATLEVTEDTKEQALATMERVIRSAVQYAHTRHYRWSPDGLTVFVLTHNGHGWTYDIMDSKRKFPSSCGLNMSVSEGDAIAMMERHAADYVSE